jgi:hypothetical protein
MTNLDQKLHAPGIMIFRAKGDLSDDDVEVWRDSLLKFIKENEKKGACGILVDMCEVENISIDAIDTMMELLSDPEDAIGDIRMRFALIGVKPFTQRFLREALPLDEVKYIRARFFHEVSESEALAWLQAMVNSAEDLPDTKAKAAPQDTPKGPAAQAEKPNTNKKEDVAVSIPALNSPAAATQNIPEKKEDGAKKPDAPVKAESARPEVQKSIEPKK